VARGRTQQPVGLWCEKEMEDGKRKTADSKPVNATAQPHLPVFRFLFPVSCFSFD